MDIDEQGAPVSGAAAVPLLEALDKSFLLVGMNSCNYSASREATKLISEKELDALKARDPSDEIVQHALQELERRRAVDAARISIGQLTALRRLLVSRPTPDGLGPARILGLHHQLLPVTETEEYKPYESISNLGQLRTFIRTNGVSVVLHGHKHVPKAYLDQTHEAVDVAVGLQEFRRRQPILVSAVAAIGRDFPIGAEMARLVNVSAQYSRVRPISIFSVPAIGAGGNFLSSSFPRLGMTVASSPKIVDPVPVFEGDGVNDVYEQLLVRFAEESPTDSLTSIVCRIWGGASALRMPTSYVAAAGGGVSEKTFQEIVDWWQNPDPKLRPPLFNHGQRIHNYPPDISQLDGVVAAIAKAPGTTRGVVIMLSPAEDRIDDPSRKVPAFCLAQFVLDTAQRRLNCIGYFRKQQMRVWWPVNVCELARLQKEVVTRLPASGGPIGVVAGEIVTVSAVGIAGTSRPRVMVPLIDRRAAESPETIWALALDLGRRGGCTNEAIDELASLFADWEPAPVTEPDGVPIALDGLEVLEKALRVVGDREGVPGVAVLAEVIHDLHYDNSAYATLDDKPQDASEREIHYSHWSHQTKRKIDQALNAARALRKPQGSDN